jgi:hypothetical protein
MNPSVPLNSESNLDDSQQLETSIPQHAHEPGLQPTHQIEKPVSTPMKRSIPRWFQLLFLAGIGLYLLGPEITPQKSSDQTAMQPTVAPATESISASEASAFAPVDLLETNGWLVLTDPVNRYSLKYPPDWQAAKGPVSTLATLTSPDGTVSVSLGSVMDSSVEAVMERVYENQKELEAYNLSWVKPGGCDQKDSFPQRS